MDSAYMAVRDREAPGSNPGPPTNILNSDRDLGVFLISAGTHPGQVSMPVAWPTSIRWPSGSRTYARISRP